MFGLIICLLFAEWQRPGCVASAFRTTFSRLERMYGDSATSVVGSIFLNIFRIGTLALAVYMGTRDGNSGILARGYLFVLLLLLSVIMVKMFLGWLVSYTFELRRAKDVYLSHYDNLWTVLSILLYPLLLLYIHLSDNTVIPWLLLSIGAMFVLVVFVKMVMHFYRGAQTALYLALYMMTLEILPLAVIVYGAMQL